MRIRVDAHHAPKLERTPVPTPVKIKPPRIRVDLDRNAGQRGVVNDEQ
jgi:hypothetical protein